MFRKVKINNFGAIVEHYKKGRSGYPQYVYNYFKKFVNGRNYKILDIGCGTGFATRSLSKFGNVIGCDIDSRMIKTARMYPQKGVSKYIVASAEKLPFAKNSFDIVTTFSSLHWFDNKKAMVEIRRVLKSNGAFFVVNKRGVKSWNNNFWKAIRKSSGYPIAKFPWLKFDAYKSLSRFGFKNIKKKIWNESERFSVERAVELIQSASVWNSVPLSLRPKTVQGLKQHYKAMKEKKGKIEKRYRIIAVIGTK